MDSAGPKAEGPCMRLGASDVLFFASYESRHGEGMCLEASSANCRSLFLWEGLINPQLIR